MNTEPTLTTPQVDALIARLWPDGETLDGTQIHAVVDAARDPRLIGLLDATGLERCCLFAGALSPALRAAAPHLVHLSPTAPFTRQFLQLGWGRSWGLLMLGPPDVTLQQLRKHLRTLLQVQDEAGRALMFRFYDPRVLRSYLPSCTPAELRQLFGPVRRFACEPSEGDGLQLFDREAMLRPRQPLRTPGLLLEQEPA